MEGKILDRCGEKKKEKKKIENVLRHISVLSKEKVKQDNSLTLNKWKGAERSETIQV